MINTNMSLHHYRHDVILLMSLVAALVLFLLVFLGVIVTWRLRKKPGEFSLYTFWRTDSILLCFIYSYLMKKSINGHTVYMDYSM